MATKTITVDSTNHESRGRGGEWVYIDKNGDPHTIKDAQEVAFTMTDGGAADVRYYVTKAEVVETYDGYKIEFYMDTGSDNVTRYFQLRDAYQNTTTDYSVPGEICAKCPVTGIIQRWKVAAALLDDVDGPSTITTLKLEDQFGNVMNLPSDAAGTITIA